VVSQEDHRGAECSLPILEPGVSPTAGLGLSGIWTEFVSLLAERQPILRRESADPLGDLSTFLVDAMIHVGDHELEAVRVLGRHQQVEQHHRITAARHSNERRPRLQFEGREAFSEYVYQTHHNGR
jgi:hypothetical protein